MTKKLFAALAMATSVLLLGAMTAQAADVTFGGQIRLRGEAWSGTGGTDLFVNDNFNSFIGNRVRLNTKVKVDDTLSAFIQFQSSTRFADGRGPLNGNSDASDSATDVGLHQAYFVQKNLFGLVDLKAGRQEIVLDGHRLFGHTGWTTGAQASDALMLTHAHDNMTVKVFFLKQAENAKHSDGPGDFVGPDADDQTDDDYYALWVNYKGLIGDKSSTSGYVVLADNDGQSAGGLSSDYWTFGARQAGAMAGLDYRVEGYIQEGKSGKPNVANNESGDRSSYLIAGRIGKKFGNVMWKPKITAWADYRSGTSIEDALAGDTGSFNTLFDTGHKFYGFMDFFLTEGSAAQGLIDLAGKMAISPYAKTTIKLDYHHFQRSEEAVAGGNKTLGQEIDLTIVYKYSANMKMVAGYSRFFARDKFAGIDTSTDIYDDAQWAYLMLDMKF